MTFRSIFLAVFIGVALIAAAWILNAQRPSVEVTQPTPELVKASGKCATCHRQETEAIVAEFEMSEHAEVGVTCLDCHQATDAQTGVDHRGFTITDAVTPANCAQCHGDAYRQFLRSRHAAPAFAAVTGSEPFTEEQIAFAEQYHPGAVLRPANALAQLEGQAAIESGCVSCHSIGEPHDDGSIGNCTPCHARHQASVAVARTPEACGQCHMGPDHSQFEIYSESKHGVLYNAQKAYMNMHVDPEDLGVEDMPVPSCATCHMSGLENLEMTHDVTERLSYWLFAEVSERRPTYLQGRAEMMEVCSKCHTNSHTERFFERAEAVLEATNEKVANGMQIVADLRAEGLLTPQPFDEPIEFAAFDFWHYYGRTAKHGAFMGGADFVQWHGNYELLLLSIEMQAMADELRERHGSSQMDAAAQPTPTP